MFSSVASSVLWFIVAIGVLVTVHEFGHFWVARRLGVKVLRFSVGFGRPLLSWRAKGDDVEYCVGTIPLGGYVKMLDEREGKVRVEELPRAFNRQPLGVRIAIVAAGPIANFLFAVAAYWLMFWVGVTGFKPLVGSVEDDSRAALAGLVPGQEIVSVDGRPTPTWQGFIERILGATLKGDAAELVVSAQAEPERTLTIRLEGLRLDDLTQGQLFDALGLNPSRPQLPPLLGSITAGSAADRAGLMPGDRVIRVDGEAIAAWDQFVALVRGSPDVPLRLDVQRGGEVVSVTVVPRRIDEDEQTFGRIGAAVAPAEIDYAEFQARERYPVGEAFTKALAKTWDMTALTLRLLYKMVTFEVSVKNLSGPISIAQYAGLSAQVGVARFLDFLAIVSISLGILNFLPIPLLDGGHLMYYCIELLRGRPVSEQTQYLGQRLGVAMLVGLMGLAFYNDLARLFG